MKTCHDCLWIGNEDELLSEYNEKEFRVEERCPNCSSTDVTE